MTIIRYETLCGCSREEEINEAEVKRLGHEIIVMLPPPYVPMVYVEDAINAINHDDTRRRRRVFKFALREFRRKTGQPQSSVEIFVFMEVSL